MHCTISIAQQMMQLLLYRNGGDVHVSLTHPHNESFHDLVALECSDVSVMGVQYAL